MSNAFWTRTKAFFRRQGNSGNRADQQKQASSGTLPQTPQVSGAGTAPGSGTIRPAHQASEVVWKFPHQRKETPWKNPGVLIRPQAIVLHHSDGSYKGGIEWITNPKHNAKVSYHCLIATNGERTQFMEWNQRAWHAGKSSWQGRPDLNSWSIGISWELNTYHRALSKSEMESAAEVIRYLMAKFNIPRDYILTHRVVSPGRKDDPSPQAFQSLMAIL